jgi:benzoate 4-monooxygenase
VYAHGNGALKSDFYDAFVSIHRGLFNTRDRDEHSRKRKIVSAIFSQKNMNEFEPYIRTAVHKLMTQWDRLYEESAAFGAKRAWFDCLSCWFSPLFLSVSSAYTSPSGYNYLAFDIIGDLAFGSPFGMVDAGKDVAPVAVETGGKTSIEYIPAIKILNDRGDFSASMGVLPPWIRFVPAHDQIEIWLSTVFRPYVKKIPWYARGNKAVQNLAGVRMTFLFLICFK